MPPRRHIAWIACFAMLFNLLAMPLSSAMPKGPAEQLLWGAFCSSGAGQAEPQVQALAKIDLGHPSDDASLQHCWCCLGAAQVVALSGHAPQLHHPAHAVFKPAVEHLDAQPTPRQLWPGLNPRASPPA